MAKDVVGTPNKLNLGGLSLRVAADASPKGGKPASKNEGEMTTGGLFRKMTSQSQESESWSVLANGDEIDQLKSIAESTDDITMSYETKAGDVYRATGFIDFDGIDHGTGKVELKLFPRQGWTSFVSA